MRRTVITGLGVVSPIGCGKDDYWNALAEGRNGVDNISLFDTEGHTAKIAAEVRGFDVEPWMDKKEARKTDRVLHFTIPATDMALKDAGLDLERENLERVGVYIGSGEGGITTTHENYDILKEKGPSRISPFFVPMMLSNMPAAYTAMRFGAKGPNMAVVTACSTATHCMGEAMHAIRRGDADVMLVGGVEAAITPIAIAGFANMKALSSRNNDPARASRPFDIERDGFVMGEGAGILIFEEMEHAKARRAHIYAEVSGYANTCDAYHITAPAPEGEGTARAIKLTLSMAGWSPDQVELYNAHGTSTPLNDKTESGVIHRIFGEHAKRLFVHSTKSMIGHCLGAAGAVEMIAALMAVERGLIHPTINYEHPDPECDVNISSKTIEHHVDMLLVNNAGFGGHNAVLAVERFKG